MKYWITAIIAFWASQAAYAGDLTISVTDQNGVPLEHAVVSLAPKFTPMSPMPVAAKAEMRQEGAMFSPFVLAVPVGTSVSFPNLDEFRHQVYSFSKAKRFELRLYGQDESKSVQFDAPGVVALGCNIHDNMLAYVYVSEFPILGQSGEDGQVIFRGLENGDYDVHFWHPDLQTGEQPMAENVTVASDVLRQLNQAINLRPFRSVQQPPSEDDYN